MDNNITFTFTEQIPYTDKQNLQDYYNNTNRNLQKNILKNGTSPFPRAFTPFTYSPFKKGKDKLINQKQKLTDIEIESGLEILNHFEEPLYPRKISTFKSNNKQFLIRSRQEIIDSFIDSNFVDCRINAYPSLIEYKGIQRYKPNFLFIDFDKNNFKTDKDLNLLYTIH